MKQYLDLMRHVREHGARKEDRTGTGTLSVFGYQMRFDLAEGFPLVTTKKLHLRSIIHELLWFLRGDTNVALPAGERRHHLGRVGRRERRAGAGLRHAVALLADAPTAATSTRSARSSSRSGTTPTRAASSSAPGTWPRSTKMALPPCHAFFQFYVADGRLSCQLYQRSADIFLGVPFNIASYALLTLMVAQVTGLQAGRFRAYPRRCAPLPEPPRTGRAAARARAAALAAHAHQSRGQRSVRLPLRGFRAAGITTRTRTSRRRWPCER